MPVFVELLVDHQVGIEVGLLLAGLRQAVATALVVVTPAGILAFALHEVVVVVGFGNPLQPRSEGPCEFQVRTNDGFLLVVLVLPD